MISRINAERQLVGKGPVGFINPALYASLNQFTDITEGRIYINLILIYILV